MVERLEGGAEGVLMIGSQGHRCLKQRKVRRRQARGEEGTELTTFLESLTRATFFYIAMATFVLDF